MPSILSAVPSSRALQDVFKNPELSAPELSAMQEDIDRIIASVARRYADCSCYALRYDDLVAEGNYKLSVIVTKGILTRMKSRQEFFKYFKTAINNHIKSLVQRHRGTIKRMGDCLVNGGKPEISLDLDEDDHTAPLQLGTLDARTSELIEAMKLRLNPVERLVFDQMLEPNDAAMALATLEANRGYDSQTSLIVKVETVHQAEGIGLEPAAFLKIQHGLYHKLKQNMATQEDAKYNLSLAVLEERFGVQVPPYVEPIIVKRLFTLAARDHADRLDDPTRQALVAVGAKLPETTAGGTLACYGVLYQRNHRICNQCALREACGVEAANHGLGEIVLSHRMMGARMTRVPTLTVDEPVRVTVSDEPVAETKHDEQLTTLLEEAGLRRTVIRGETYYRHKTGRPRYIFWLGHVTGRPGVSLRFCRPSEALKPKLEFFKRCWHLAATNQKTATALVHQHVAETYREA